MPDFEQLTGVLKDDIAGVPVWGIVGGGAVGLLVLTRLVGGGKSAPGGLSSPTPEPTTSPPENNDKGITRGEYDEVTGQYFETLGSDLNTRFGDLGNVIQGGQDAQRLQFQDFTGELAALQSSQSAALAAQKGGFDSLSGGNRAGFAATQTGLATTQKSIATSSAETKAQLTRVEGKVDALAAAETRRENKYVTMLERVIAKLNQLIPDKKPPVQK